MGTHKSLEEEVDKGIKTEAERFLEEFHANIPSVGTVMRYNVNGAKHCLVHVKQSHYVDGINEELLEKVNDVQKDIYKILSYMVDNYNLRKIYNEGVSKKTITTYKELKDLETQLLKRSRHWQQVGDDCRELYKKFWPELGYFDAVRRLFVEGKIGIEAAEIEEKLNAAFEAYRNKDPTKDELDGKREDVLLELVYQNKDPVAVTVYGGGHDFIDNVDKWNKLHPKDKFCLVIVNPNAYIQYERKSLGLNSNAEEPVSGKRAILEKK